MSEHSKGPELRYSWADGRIREVANGEEFIRAVVYYEGTRAQEEEALQKRDALGRKMAAAPELVEWLDNAREWMRRNPPPNGMGGVDCDEERERQRLLEAGARLLKKAGGRDSPTTRRPSKLRE